MTRADDRGPGPRDRADEAVERSGFPKVRDLGQVGKTEGMLGLGG